MTFAALPYGLLADSGTALTISYAYPDVGFNIYRVAEEVNGKYQFTKNFEGCGADLDVKYNSEREALISVLSTYVKDKRNRPDGGRSHGRNRKAYIRRAYERNIPDSWRKVGGQLAVSLPRRIARDTDGRPHS